MTGSCRPRRRATFGSPTNLGSGNANVGFIRLVTRNGVTKWPSVNDPLVNGTSNVNEVLGINSSLNAVGFFTDRNNNSHGFVYSVNSGTFSR